MTNGITANKLLISLTAVAVSLGSTAAFADSPKSDYFSRSTNPSTSIVIPPTPQRPQIQKTAVRLWFESVDQKVKSLVATDNEMFILNRPFGSPPQLERVTEWMNTASTVA